VRRSGQLVRSRALVAGVGVDHQKAAQGGLA
jgi:hypothetical protein